MMNARGKWHTRNVGKVIKTAFWGQCRPLSTDFEKHRDAYARRFAFCGAQAGSEARGRQTGSRGRDRCVPR